MRPEDSVDAVAPPLRVGIVGCGLIAQVMHLPHLQELADRFEIAAVCDISPAVAGAAVRRFAPHARVSHDWRELIADDIDALLVLTPGSHAPVVEAAAAAGMHVFAEKPLAVGPEEAASAAAAADAAGSVLMVGYMKRYEPAWEALVDEELPAVTPLQVVRTTTLEAPLEPYVSHLDLVAGGDAPPATLAALAEDDDARVRQAIGALADDPTLRRLYRFVLLDCLIHELNLLRGTLGDPTEVRWVHATDGARTVTVQLAFGDVECVMLWSELDRLGRYEQEFAFYGPERRAALRFPSPFLASTPAVLVTEGGSPGAADSWRRERTVSYVEPFKRELIAFHDCIRGSGRPRVGGHDAARDIALARAIAQCAASGGPIDEPARLGTVDAAAPDEGPVPA